MSAVELIVPEWPAPANVRACSSTRRGGVSLPPYDALNLGGHTDDDPDAVAENRRRLREAAGMPAPPRWLAQVHGTEAVYTSGPGEPVTADAAWTDRPGAVCAVLTADCLPVVLCDRAGTRVAVAHAGWRGLCAGVLESTLNAMGAAPGECLAWLGPAIGPDVFEVGEEVRAAFLEADPQAADAFRPSPAGRWLADLYRLARQRLQRAGVNAIHGGGWCTYSETDRFFSHRRANPTGRMATAVWLDTD